MNCLKNYIQIEGCVAPAYDYSIEVEGESVPQTPSGLFINKDLPISLEEIDKIADSEQQTFLGVWEEVQNRALKKFLIVVKAGYRELFNSCTITDDWFCENRALLAMPLLYFLGSELLFERLYSSRINRWTIEKEKARSLKAEFDGEFKSQLHSALQLINAGVSEESGAVFTYVEVIP